MSHETKSASTSDPARTSAVGLQRLFQQLFPDVVCRGAHDETYFLCLVQEFGERANLDHEMKQFHAWYLDQPASRTIHYRSRFRLWLSSGQQRLQGRAN